jgi:hypothetical protein
LFCEAKLDGINSALTVLLQLSIHRYGHILVRRYITKLDDTMAVPSELSPVTGFLWILLNSTMFAPVNKERNRAQAIVAGPADAELFGAYLDLRLVPQLLGDALQNFGFHFYPLMKDLGCHAESVRMRLRR